MRVLAVSFLVTWSLAGLGHPAPPVGQVLLETWDAAYLGGVRSGHVRTEFREIERDGVPLIRSTADMELTLRRGDAVVRIRMESGTEETKDGRVVGVFMVQHLDQGKKLVLEGKVTDDVLHVRVDNGRIERKIPWDNDIIGLYRQYHLFKDRAAKPGDQLSYRSFEPSINAVMTVRVEVKEEEEVEAVGGRRRLLRVEATPDKIVVPGATVQLPPMVHWLGPDLLSVRSEMELPGIGRLVLHRTSREEARQPAGRLPDHADIFATTTVRLNREIANPHATRSAVYRVAIKGDQEAGSAFATDDRQSVKNANGETFELHVQAQAGPPAPPVADAPRSPGREFLAPNYFIDSDQATVQELARRAVGGGADPWAKAQRIERWVFDNIQKKNYTVTFSRASQVAQNLEGDCRQHAILCAAMCRAAGVPSRTAMGLVYFVDRDFKPVMGFHMWTEVWINGQWLALDATLGQGGVGAAHIKVSDHSWHEVESLTPFLPVLRVVGKLSIEVVRVDGR